MSTFALGKSETCTVSVRRAPDINDKHYFLRASPTDKFALGNSSKGLIDRSNLVGETGRWWAKGSKSETCNVSQKSPSAHADCSSQVPPKFLPSFSHFSADENRRRKERTKEQWGRCFCTGAWRCVLKGLGFSSSKRPEKEGQIEATLTIKVLASIQNNQIDESGLSVRVTLTLKKGKRKKGAQMRTPKRILGRVGWVSFRKLI